MSSPCRSGCRSAVRALVLAVSTQVRGCWSCNSLAGQFEFLARPIWSNGDRTRLHEDVVGIFCCILSVRGTFLVHFGVLRSLQPALTAALRGALKRASKARPPEPEEPERAAQVPGGAVLAGPSRMLAPPGLSPQGQKCVTHFIHCRKAAWRHKSVVHRPKQETRASSESRGTSRQRK